MFNQLVFDSNNSLDQLRTIILKDNPKNILLFTGKKSFKVVVRKKRLKGTQDFLS